MNTRTLDLIDQCNERSRWALGIVSMIAVHCDTADDVKDAAACASRQLEDLRQLLRDYCERERSGR